MIVLIWLLYDIHWCMHLVRTLMISAVFNLGDGMMSSGV
jgi:hypothetical protein